MHVRSHRRIRSTARCWRWSRRLLLDQVRDADANSRPISSIPADETLGNKWLRVTDRRCSLRIWHVRYYRAVNETLARGLDRRLPRACAHRLHGHSIDPLEASCGASSGHSPVPQIDIFKCSRCSTDRCHCSVISAAQVHAAAQSPRDRAQQSVSCSASTGRLVDRLPLLALRPGLRRPICSCELHSTLGCLDAVAQYAWAAATLFRQTHACRRAHTFAMR
jgi:hypothetical protein